MADVVGPSQDSDPEVPEEEKPSVLRTSSSTSLVTPSPNPRKALFQDPSPPEVVKEQKPKESATIELDGKLSAAEAAKLTAMGKLVPTGPKATKKATQAAETGPQSSSPTGLSGDSANLVVDYGKSEAKEKRNQVKAEAKAKAAALAQIRHGKGGLGKGRGKNGGKGCGKNGGKGCGKNSGKGRGKNGGQGRGKNGGKGRGKQSNSPKVPQAKAGAMKKPAAAKKGMKRPAAAALADPDAGLANPSMKELDEFESLAVGSSSGTPAELQSPDAAPQTPDAAPMSRSPAVPQSADKKESADKEGAEGDGSDDESDLDSLDSAKHRSWPKKKTFAGRRRPEGKRNTNGLDTWLTKRKCFYTMVAKADWSEASERLWWTCFTDQRTAAGARDFFEQELEKKRM